MSRPQSRLGGDGELLDVARADVLLAVDPTHADLVDRQEQLERRNAELSSPCRLMDSVSASVSDVLIVLDPLGRVEEASRSLWAALAAMRTRPEGQEAALLGRVTVGRGRCGRPLAVRIVDILAGEQLPRIC